MIKKTLSLFYKIIKNKKLELDLNVDDKYLIDLLFNNFFYFIRGGLRGFAGVLINKNVIFKGKKIYIGKGSIIGSGCKFDALGIDGIHIGKNCSIGDETRIKVSGTLANIGKGVLIEDGVGIGEFGHIGGAGGVTIGCQTIIGPFFSCHPENHKFSCKKSLIKDQGVTRKGIHIGSNCWIGAKVTVLDGAIIGSGCVIAAGSVVNSIIPDNMVVAGVPARVIRNRFHE